MTVAEQAAGLEIAVDNAGPLFLGLTVAERSRRLARRAAIADPKLAGMLRLPDNVALTRELFDALPRVGTWQVYWKTNQPPLAWQAAAGGIGLPKPVAAPPESVFDVSTTEERRAAEWTLLRRSGKATDGWLSRHVHRKISRLFSWSFLRLGLRADHATWLTFAVGVVSAALMAQTSHATMILGAFLFWFASVADGIDGEMARLSLSESARGEQLDTFVDDATHVLCYAGVIAGWWRQGISPREGALGVAVTVALPLTLLWAMHLVRSGSGATEFFVDTKPIELGVTEASRTTGSPLLRLASGVFVLFRREAFSLTFFLVSLVTGWRGIYVALLGGGVTFVLFTLLVYKRSVESAIRDRFARLRAA